MKAVILARVSSKEQEEGYSLDAQKDRLINYCNRNNLEVIKTFTIIESSTQGTRKNFNEMLNFCKNKNQPLLSLQTPSTVYKEVSKSLFL